jgi:hypothetical protein
MTATVLPTWRPWYQRLFEFACAQWARRIRISSVRHPSLSELDARTLRDIGIDVSELASIQAESQGRAEVTRLRILLGQGHV